MKRLVELWRTGLDWLITDYCISFFTYFTIIFAECAYVWSYYSTEVAIPFTVILLAYVLNVIVFGWLKGIWEGTRKELIFSILYVIMFIGLCIIGCIFNTLLCLALTIIPLIITYICIQLRDFQATNGFLRLTNKTFIKGFLYIVSQVIIIGCPYAIFVIFLVTIPTFPILLKVLIPVLYFIGIPFISLLEDEGASCNIFQIAYDITWDKDFEEFRNKMN